MSTLFRNTREDFSMPRCANPECQKFMVGVRYPIVIGDQKFKVCSFECETALKMKHGESLKPKKEHAPGKPSQTVEWKD